MHNLTRLSLILGAASVALPATGSGATPAVARAARFAEFQTPSGNIACGMSTAFGVRCDIAEHTWTGRKPATADCKELDFGGFMEVTRKGKGHFVCTGDTLLHQGAVLAYGQHRSVGRWSCTSRSSGMTCRNRRNGHGFTLARASYRFF